MVISVYSIPHVIKLTLDDFSSTERYMIVSAHYTNTEIKLVRGTDQKVDFLVKNYDRHPVPLGTNQLVFRIYDRFNNEIYTSNASIINEDKGHYAVEIPKISTTLFKVGEIYSWCATFVDALNETERMLFANRDYGTHSKLTVMEGPRPLREEVQVIDIDSLSQLRSSALKGAAQVGNYAGNHSFVFNLEDFTGTITIQATIDEDIPVIPSEWVDLDEIDLVDFTGNRHISFNGNYYWVRFILSTDTGVTSVNYQNI